jgi:tetratricopeptide (TPR) repeat protein
VEFAGCAEVFENRVCGISNAHKRLLAWVQTEPTATIQIDAGEGATVSAPVVVQGGRRFEINFGKAVDALTVKVKDNLGRTGTKRLPLRFITLPPAIELIEKARQSGKLPEAVALFEKNKATLGDDVLSLEARLALSAGEMPKAMALFEKSIALYREKGRTQSAVYDAVRLVYLLMFRSHDFKAAQKWLSFCETTDPSFDEIYYRVKYFRSLFTWQLGDYRQALDNINEATEIADRFDLDDQFWAVLNQRLSILFDLGRFDEAEETLKLMEDSIRKKKNAHPCQTVALMSQRAWLSILKSEAGEPILSDPVPLLLEARRLGETALKCEWNAPAVIIINLAHAYLQKAEIEKAYMELKRFETDKIELNEAYRFWQLDLAARISLKRGKYKDAIALYSELRQLGEIYAREEVRWRASVGLAEVYLATAKQKKAIAMLREAHEQTSEGMLRIPLGEGRAAFVAQRHRALALFLEQLLKQGQVAAALSVARQDRTRVLQSIVSAARGRNSSSQDDEVRAQRVSEFIRERDALRQEMKDLWRLPADKIQLAAEQHKATRAKLRRLMDEAFSPNQEAASNFGDQSLTAPPAGSVYLFYFNLGRDWVAFAMDATQTVASRLPEVPLRGSPEELSASLLGPFQLFIERNRRVEVVLTGALQRIDFHLLPWQQAPLIAHKEVVYKLDLPAGDTQTGSAAEAKSDAQPPKALVVLDPRMDLPGARKESRVLEQLLKNWKQTILTGTQASVAAFKEGLSQADFLYYAGHGMHSGNGGMESSLLLAGRDTLEVGDVLALPRVPRTAVLLGCETGVTENDHDEWGLSLAQAFLIAGSREVVGTVRPVDDAMAERFSHALGETETLGDTPLSNVSRTLSKLAASGTANDVGAIRVFSR